MTRSQDAAPPFIPASSTTAGPPAPASTRRTTLRPGSTSGSRTRFTDRLLQDPLIGEVAEGRDMAFPDPEDLDGRRRERPARRGDRPLRPHLRDHHLRVLGLVKLDDLEVLQPQRRRHDLARILADRLPAL